MRALWLFAAGGALAAPLLAQDATTVAVPGEATAQGDVAVTIYQNGQSLVQDTHGQLQILFLDNDGNLDFRRRDHLDVDAF